MTQTKYYISNKNELLQYDNPPPYTPPKDIDLRIRNFQARREINEKFIPAIRNLSNYDLVYMR
jgi:hypothetical protein